jgi:ABC-type transporter Mla MlaB component
MPIRNRTAPPPDSCAALVQAPIVPSNGPRLASILMNATRKKRGSAAATPLNRKSAGDRPADDRSSTAVVIALASHCTVKDAAALKQTLCEVVQEAQPVIVDVQDLQRIDTAALQLLCAFVRERTALGRRIQWCGDPALLREAAGLLGVAALLRLPEPGLAAAGAAT